VVLPRLLEFAPDMIFVSAGFDGHAKDRLAAGECDFGEEDFYWMTEQLMGVAQMTARGRLVSVLEGGYNTRAGWLSPLSQSVTAHVRALSASTVSRVSGLAEPARPSKKRKLDHVHGEHEEEGEGGEEEGEEEEEEEELVVVV
jgi:acetoin utilization deacetylase AcuC-like enzyme